jgi:hypothetical protein
MLAMVYNAGDEFSYLFGFGPSASACFALAVHLVEVS